MKKLLPSFAAILVFVFSAHAHAQLFKCKDASGKNTYQETPCASGEQKTLRTDAAATASSGSVTGNEKDKRIELNRSASKDTLDSCIKHHRPDLKDILANFNVTSNMTKRLWLTSAGVAERILVTVNISENNKLAAGERVSFTCVLRGDELTDAVATREYASGR